MALPVSAWICRGVIIIEVCGWVWVCERFRAACESVGATVCVGDVSVCEGLKEGLELAERIGSRLAGAGRRMATAESCTGGLIAHWLTSIPGSSVFYAGGVVAYADTVKSGLLGVPPALIATHGAVSEPVAAAMAAGAVDRLNVDVAVSTSGIAGPSGGTPQKPVGLVYIGLAVRGGDSRASAFHFSGSRRQIQIAAGKTALEMVEEVLQHELNL